MRIMALSLQEKIQDTNQGVYLIGTTPPKIGTDKAQLTVIAEKLLGRLHEIEYDGVIIYDIQDESSRTEQARPFAFKQTVDPREYSQLLRGLSDLDVITYKSVAQRGVSEFKAWLDETKNDYDLKNVVLVGSPSYCSSPARPKASNRSLRFIGIFASVRNEIMNSRLGTGFS